MDDRFCTYREEDGTFCGKKTKNVIINNCCIKHLKYLYPDLYKRYRKEHQKNYYVKKDKNNIYYCIATNMSEKRCKRKVKNENDVCCKHKDKIDIIKKDKSIIYFGELKTEIDIINIDKYYEFHKPHKIKKRTFNINDSSSIFSNNNYNKVYNYDYNITFGNINIEKRINNNNGLNTATEKYTKNKSSPVFQSESKDNLDFYNISNKEKILNNYVNNYNGHILFGSVDEEIPKDKNKDISLEVTSNENKICNTEFKNNFRKRILTKTRIINYFNKLYIKNKKNNKFMDNINEDLYYVFLYSINLIFKNKNINFIRKEIYNCLGKLGISYCINQFNILD
jgi:hypothetical protein